MSASQPVVRALVGFLGVFTVLAASAAGCTLTRSGRLQQTCTSAAECELDNPCYVAECSVNGQCIFTPADNSAVLEQTPNDCARWACVIDGDLAAPQRLPADEDRPEDVECVTRYTCVDGELIESGVGPGTLCGLDDRGQCADGRCVVGCEEEGDPACDDGNVCTDDLCNLATNVCEHVALDNIDAPAQTEGDCRVVLCVLGSQSEIYDDLDVLDDDSECTTDTCNQGQPVNSPLAAGTACTANDPLASVCDALGSCVQCNADVECIGFLAGWDDTDCQTPRCVSGVCELSCEPLGTVAAVQSGTPDCQTTVCDGACGYVDNVDDSDVPDDLNDCTDDFCDLGTVMHPPEPANTSCGTAGLCDGNGNCGACNVDSDCQADTFCRDFSCDTTQSPHQCVFANVNEGVALPSGQQDGNCHTLRCSAGLPENQIDDADLPVDGLECTDDLCTVGVPTNPPLAIDEPCTEGGGRFCNGNGACVDCNDVSQCSGADGVCDHDACLGNDCVVVFEGTGTNAPLVCQSATPDCQVVKCDGAGECGASVPDDADVVDDGNECTFDSCSGGVEVHDPAPVEGMVCTQNGVFCDGPETCQVGLCLASGNPCPGHDTGPDCDDSCDEGAGTCTAPDSATTSCSDGSFCNGADVCDGLGACINTGTNPCPGHDVGPDCDDSCRELGGGAGDCAGPDAALIACDDGLFCTGADVCDGTGACLGGADPCDGPDGDALCAESCDEAANACTLPDPNGSECGGGNVCIGGACADVRLVFVTSAVYDGDDLGSVAAAHAECGARAAAAGLVGTYRAWLADTATPAGAGFSAASVPYVLLDGTTIADDFADLTDGTLAHAIDVDEGGAAVGTASVWTGALASGAPAASQCLDWTSQASGESGHTGSTGEGGPGWTDGAALACDETARLYCFEQ